MFGIVDAGMIGPVVDGALETSSEGSMEKEVLVDGVAITLMRGAEVGSMEEGTVVNGVMVSGSVVNGTLMTAGVGKDIRGTLVGGVVGLSMAGLGNVI